MTDPAITPRKTPVQSRSRATFEAILEAGAQVLVHSGPGEVTVDRIAERAGVSIGSLYQYFPGKQAILAELVRRMRADMLTDLERATAAATGLPLTEGAQIILAGSVRHHQRAPALAAALEQVEEALPLDAETLALKTRISTLISGYLDAHGVPEPDIAARDLSAISRAMTEAAIAAGETDMAPVLIRLERATRGYLGLPPG